MGAWFWCEKVAGQVFEHGEKQVWSVTHLGNPPDPGSSRRNCTLCMQQGMLRDLGLSETGHVGHSSTASFGVTCSDLTEKPISGIYTFLQKERTGPA